MMSEITTLPLYFKSDFQVILFFHLLNSKEPLERDVIAKQTDISRSTCFDNLTKLSEMKVEGCSLVSKYRTKSNGLRGRPKVKWLVPKKVKDLLYSHFISIEIQ